MKLNKALSLRKAKYTKRWKGKDGKWHYEYGKKTGKIKVKVRDQLGNLEVMELDKDDPLTQMYLKRQKKKQETTKQGIDKLKKLGIKTFTDIDKHKKGNESRYNTLKRLVGESTADKLMRELEAISWIGPVKKSLQKAKKMPIGTVSHGRKKVAEGKWVPVPKGKQKTSKKWFDKPDKAEGVKRTTHTFDIYKEGWKTPKDVDKKIISISEKNPDKYVTTHNVFQIVYITEHVKLPSGVYAPDDFPLGYWKGGKHFDWSEKRKARASMAGLSVSDR